MFITCILENGKKCMLDFNYVQAIVEINDQHCRIIFDDPNHTPVVIKAQFNDIEVNITKFKC